LSERKSVLVLLGAFWPGHEATGPNMSARAMCEALSDEFAFRIIARDRPFGAAEPLVDDRLWHDRGYAAIHYLPVGRTGAKRLSKLIGQTPHDMLMLNSFFDREFTLPALGWGVFLPNPRCFRRVANFRVARFQSRVGAKRYFIG
jgi:hypothetical protein